MPHRPINELNRSTLLVVVVAIMVGYPLAVLVLGPSKAIEVGNLIMLSLWTGVWLAYMPSTMIVFREPRLDGATILSLGIFLGGIAVIWRAGGSIMWRVLGKPDGWIDSPYWSYHIAWASTSALCHLLAPQAMNGRIPTTGWIKIGSYVAFGVFVFGLITLFSID